MHRRRLAQPLAAPRVKGRDWEVFLSTMHQARLERDLPNRQRNNPCKILKAKFVAPSTFFLLLQPGLEVGAQLSKGSATTCGKVALHQKKTLGSTPTCAFELHERFQCGWSSKFL